MTASPIRVETSYPTTTARRNASPVAPVACPAASAAEITGAGASFPNPIYSKWADAYQKATGNRMNYQSIGSSGGLRQIKAKTVDFGASDAPLKSEELQKDNLIQFPTVFGAPRVRT